LERSDDWCATAYFHLDKPVSNLPSIQPYAQRLAALATSADAGKPVEADQPVREKES
jgi:hypothetical protein